MSEGGLFRAEGDRQPVSFLPLVVFLPLQERDLVCFPLCWDLRVCVKLPTCVSLCDLFIFLHAAQLFLLQALFEPIAQSLMNKM